MKSPAAIFRLLFIAVFSTASWVAAAASAHAQAAAYVISDSTSGFVLEQSNAAKKLQIASLTKIATAMVVLDWSASKKVDLSELATVPGNVGKLVTTGGVGFAPGDHCSLRDLLYAALMQSDNAAAETLADHVGRALGAGPEVSGADVFVAQMNALAKARGMLRTRFRNAHGLDSLESAVPYSTAEDLAKLTAYAMANSAFRFYVSQPERKIALLTANGEQSGYLLRNTNELLGVNNIDGVKTGTTKRAGQCLIISAAKPPESRQEGDRHFITPRRLNVVVLGSGDRFNVAAQFLERGWTLHEQWAAAGRPVGKPRR